jgi:periplasmic mercuric ion binding protein
MKTFKLFLLAFLFIFITQLSFAQSAKKETFNVAGECGMCKKKIETAAKNAGATYAVWDVDTKKLTVKYKTSSNSAKIQQSVADAGYDTQDIKASEDAYNKLHECCRYERTASSDCCSKKDMACCEEGQDKDCCKKS